MHWQAHLKSKVLVCNHFGTKADDMAQKTTQKRSVTQDQFGQLMRHAMNDSAQALPDDIVEKLALARRKAVSVRKQPAHERSFISMCGDWLMQLSSGATVAFPVLLLGVGIYVLSENSADNYTHSVAELDAQVLTQEVPIDALLDKGFVRYVQLGE